MTHFEYLAVSFSIVLSFAVIRILGGVSDVFARSRWYWVHAGWVAHQLLFVTYVWWIVWSYRNVTWNFFTFLAVLTGVGLVYYQTTTLIPAQPAAIDSWRAHFYAMRKHYFGATVAWCLVILFNTLYILHVPALHPSRVGQLTTLVVGVIGVLTGREWVHRVLVWIMFVLWPIRAALALAPGALNFP
jgi:hypothetical protein